MPRILAAGMQVPTMGLRPFKAQPDPARGQTPVKRTPGPQTGTTGGLLPDFDPMGGYKNEDLLAQQNADREAFLKRSPKPAPTAAAPAASGAAPVGTAVNPSPGAPQVMPSAATARNPIGNGAYIGEKPPETYQMWTGPNRPANLDPNANQIEPGVRIGQPQPQAPVPAKQSVEANMPLAGAPSGTAPTGTITAPPTINPGSAFGVNSRGNTPPIGSSTPNSFTGGFGPMERTFSNPGSAGLYHDYVQRLFGNQGSGNGSMLRRSPEVNHTQESSQK